MPDLDVFAPNYLRAQKRWPDASTLERCYQALGACYSADAHGLVEHVKSFVETVCITIMGEFRVPMPSAQPTTTELLVAALRPIGLQNSRGATKLDTVLSGFNKLADGLTAMRNETGAVAHGKDGFLDAIEADHARAFLHVGDAILGILLNAFEGKQPDLVATREPYERFPHLNARIDRAVAVQARVDEDGDRSVVVIAVSAGPLSEAIELRLEPSRLLYGVDRAAYVEVLNVADTSASLAEPVEEAEPTSTEGGTDLEPSVRGAETPIADVRAEYRGSLEGLRAGVEAFLEAEGLKPGAGADGGRLVDSLLATAEQNLALDWSERETIQARLKIAFKRVLVQIGTAVEPADKVAERLVAWLRIQAPGLPAHSGPARVADEARASAQLGPAPMNSENGSSEPVGGRP